MDRPFFHVRREGAGFVVDGTERCALGTRVDGDTAGGLFGEWEWDGARLTVRHDRYGFFPLYYRATDDEFAISPSIRTLIERCGAPTDLDYRGLSVFFRIGWFLGDDTPFAAIRALPRASAFSWGEGGLAVERDVAQPKEDALARDAAVDAYVELFRDAMRRRAPSDGRGVVPLSGGVDSRHIALELVHLGHRPRCVTAMPEPNMTGEEHVVAKRVAAALGLEHEILEQPGSAADLEMLKNERVNFCAPQHAWFNVVADCATVRSASAIYDGLAGDNLSASLFLRSDDDELLRGGKFDEFAARFLGGSSIIDAVLAREHADRMDVATARAHLAAYASGFQDAPNPVSAFHFASRTRRAIALAPLSILPPDRTVHTPYLDGALYDMLASQPVSHYLDGRFHKEALERAHEDGAAIAYAGKSTYVDNPAWSKRYLADTLKATRRLGRGLLRMGHLRTRILRARFSSAYRTGFAPWACPAMLYLAQIDALRRHGR